ncbi:uncharacterized protein LOC121369862 [Gigantopelta aegis]|uniref:uncharacterized protein LOC121369862 n=1 Tax=Gigantopelta aegis TaxID=1735272 RepID=UPI001B88D5D2|nr:uncharacterized protein LOC121369862 [Gigantopelta aegis]
MAKTRKSEKEMLLSILLVRRLRRVFDRTVEGISQLLFPDYNGPQNFPEEWPQLKETVRIVSRSTVVPLLYAGYRQPLDTIIIQKIHELADDGLRNVSHIKRQLEVFVEKDMISNFCDLNIQKSNRRFYATKKDIRNHLHQAVTASRKVTGTVFSLLHFASFLSRSGTLLYFSAHLFIFPRPDLATMIKRTYCNLQMLGNPTNQLIGYFIVLQANEANEHDPESFLWIFQSEFQRKMLNKYGAEITLLDATYQTTKYDLPLFFLCVCSNVGYMIVGAFVIGKETKCNIQEALTIIKKWNPDWFPAFFMCDCDHREIAALESIFQGTHVYLCDFHKYQAWQRWLRSKKNGIGQNKDDILKRLMKISNAQTNEEYEIEVKHLKESNIFKDNLAFQNWISKHWLAEHTRWVYCFRKNIFNIRVNTTNGLENQHKLLKENYLRQFSLGKTLSSALSVLVKTFTPDIEQRYIRLNVICMNEYCKYDDGIPSFLKNRPRLFLDHCLKRMPPTIPEIGDDSISSNGAGFVVSNPASRNTHRIEFGEQMPSCSCMDWKKYHWPCKHLLAVFTKYPDHGWDFLPEGYKEQPTLCLDKDIINKAKGIAETQILEETQQQINLLPDDIYQDKSEFQIRRDCFELLKCITSRLYCISPSEDLCIIKNKLMEIDEQADKLTPTLAGLPVRNVFQRAKKKKMLHMKLDMKRKSAIDSVKEAMLEKTVTNLTEIYQEMADNRVEEGLHVHSEDSNLKSCEKDVLKIWDRALTNGSPLGKIGQYILTDTSIQCLQTWLSDEVDVYSYEHIIGAINENGNHWTLMLVPEEKSKCRSR